MPLSIIRNDITKVKADAIVNTANPQPIVGGGTDKAIYEAAGHDKLLAARRKIGNIEPGEAYETPAFDLDANFIIHTAGPVWENGEAGECDVLKSCYINSLELANQYKCKSIAFPLISSGVYGFPKEVAVDIAKSSINEYLKDHDMKVYLVVFDDESLVASKGAFKKIKVLVTDEYVRVREEVEYGVHGNIPYNRRDRYRKTTELEKLEIDFDKHSIDKETFFKRRKEILEAGTDLSGILGGKQKNFKEQFFEYMDAKGLEPTEIYSGYFERKTFNKIQNLNDYHPSKSTAIQACLGMHLNISEAYQLMASASYAFNENYDPDIVIMYCIMNGIWKIRDINVELNKYGLPEFDSIY